MNEKIYSHIVMTLSFFGLCQFSSQKSLEYKEKPPVNFYGTLLDQSGNTYEIENITISGLFRDVPVFVKPRRPANPDLNKRFIDLDETAEIRVPYEGENPKIYRYKDREYIEIEVLCNDQKTKKNYIVERTRKLFANERNKTCPVEMQLGVEAIDTLTIKGHKEPEKKKVELTEEIPAGDSIIGKETHLD